MELKQVMKDIQSKPTVPLWPHVGMALDMCRDSVYAAAKRNEIDVIRVGRSIKAVTASLRKRLGLDSATA
jgi:hypothetical protein